MTATRSTADQEGSVSRYAPVVRYLGWHADTVDQDGDVFTSACLASIIEPPDDMPIYEKASDMKRGKIIMTYGEYKTLDPRPPLHVGFVSRLAEGERDEQVDADGRFIGSIFHRFQSLWLALSRGQTLPDRARGAAANKVASP